MELENQVAILTYAEERALKGALPPLDFERLAILGSGVYATRLAMILQKHFPEIDRTPEPMRTIRQQLADGQH